MIKSVEYLHIRVYRELVNLEMVMSVINTIMFVFTDGQNLKLLF